jgi:hypothetical protein
MGRVPIKLRYDTYHPEEAVPNQSQNSLGAAEEEKFSFCSPCRDILWESDLFLMGSLTSAACFHQMLAEDVLSSS